MKENNREREDDYVGTVSRYCAVSVLSIIGKKGKNRVRDEGGGEGGEKRHRGIERVGGGGRVRRRQWKAAEPPFRLSTSSDACVLLFSIFSASSLRSPDERPPAEVVGIGPREKRLLGGANPPQTTPTNSTPFGDLFALCTQETGCW
ncbi:hypothetical protein HZH68_016487 [Vespula germanica]|uniref:Uncharacterized protein n=1 Tax=Vespula germanica TaxID=30212 RepID=A0A834J4U7_VESGE|nr:hypothetical protein HZH68_016487 [Vespula germanica]